MMMKMMTTISMRLGALASLGCSRLKPCGVITKFILLGTAANFDVAVPLRRFCRRFLDLGRRPSTWPPRLRRHPLKGIRLAADKSRPSPDKGRPAGLRPRQILAPSRSMPGCTAGGGGVSDGAPNRVHRTREGPPRQHGPLSWRPHLGIRLLSPPRVPTPTARRGGYHADLV